MNLIEGLAVRARAWLKVLAPLSTSDIFILYALFAIKFYKFKSTLYVIVVLPVLWG